VPSRRTHVHHSEERRDIEAIAQSRLVDFSDDISSLEYADFIDCLRRGLAMHHAGMVPAFREIVETCFELNLLAVVSPPRLSRWASTCRRDPCVGAVLEVLRRRSKVSHQREFSQMTGRAGRRGLDDEGHAIVCFATEWPSPTSDASRWPRRQTCTRLFDRPTTSPPT